MLRSHPVDTDKVYKGLLVLGRKEQLLPPSKFLNLEEYKRETEVLIGNAYAAKEPDTELATELIGLWYPGALRVVEQEGITFTNDIDLEVQSILTEAGYPISE